MRKLLCIILSVLMLVLFTTGCAFEALDDGSKDSSSHEQAEESQQTSSTVMTEDDVKTQGEKVVLTLFFADGEATKLVAEKRYVLRENMQDLNTAAETAIKELFKGPIGGTLVSPFQKEVEIPKVKVENGLAIVDISKNLVKNIRVVTGETLRCMSI